MNGVYPYIAGVVLALIVLLILGAAALGYETYQINKPPRGSPEEFKKKGRTSPSQRVVACVGASIVNGCVSVDFVEMLRRRFPGDVFVNAGVNGDLAYNVLQRLDAVVACDPDDVVILVGTNDVQSTLNQRTAQLAVRSKKLPCAPSLDWYRENLEQIVIRLQRETRARIGLISLPILGEDLESRANQRVREFNAARRRVAGEQGAAYLPVHECQAERLSRLGRNHGQPFTGAPALVITAGVRHILLGQSLDEISRRNGLCLTTDLMHMNSQGAAFIADQTEAFLRAQPRVDRRV